MCTIEQIFIFLSHLRIYYPGFVVIFAYTLSGIVIIIVRLKRKETTWQQWVS